jgi:L-galactose dehydrogenase
MQTRSLGNTGMNVSVLGLGTAPLGGNYGAFDEAKGIRAVRAALDLGINFLDSSPYYGATLAETRLGSALVGVPRDSYYLSTKLGRYGLDDFDFSASRVRSSVEESLKRLQLDYIDILIAHDIEFRDMEQVVNETLPAMYKLREQGKARFIGISGLPLKIYSYVLDRAPLDIILSYCHYCLNDDSLASLLPYLESKNVGILNAAPTAMGLLTDDGPPPWHPAPQTLKDAAAQAAAYCRSRGRNITALAIHYSLADPRIASTFFGSAFPEQVADNIRWAKEPLDTELLAEVQKILAPVHNQTWQSGRAENN